MADLRLPFVSPLSKVVVSLQKEPIFAVSSISSSAVADPFRVNRRRIRKNHLRQKILEIPKTEILFPTIAFEEQEQSLDVSDRFVEQDGNEGIDTQEQQSQDLSDQFSEGANEATVVEELTTETVRVSGGGGGINATILSTRSVLKVGMYLVAAFLFQTIFAVLVFGPDSYERKDRRLNNEIEKEVKGNSDMGVEESEMGKKVVEIQAMARAARVKERLELERNKSDNDEAIRTGIGKEVNNKLVNMRTKLQKTPLKLPSSPAESDQSKPDLGDSEHLLMFEKKYKFKNPSAKPDNKPLGFQGFNNNGNGNGNGGRIRDEIKGTHKGKRRGKQIKSGRKVEESDQMKNSNLKSRNQNRELDDQWWLKLPYVMAIFMHGREEGEGPEGLFSITLQTSSTHTLSSHAVAFEDRGDAVNFCYILRSFFAELEDFSADILPLPVKELEVEVKSKKMKVIVVKKGQLKLYAGQSLTEVESALHSLVK